MGVTGQLVVATFHPRVAKPAAKFEKLRKPDMHLNSSTSFPVFETIHSVHVGLDAFEQNSTLRAKVRLHFACGFRIRCF